MGTTVKCLWGPASLCNTSGVITDSDFDLDAAGEKIANIFVVPKDGTITHIGFYIAATAGTFPNYYVSLETLNATGDPSGTLYGGSAQTSFVPTGGIEHRWITLSTPATANAGDIIAAVVGPGVTAPSAGNEIAILNPSIGDNIGLPRKSEYTVAWSLAQGSAPIAVKYNDGTVEGLTVTSFLGELFDQADTPDEMGNKFTLPAQMICYGARVGFNSLIADASYQICLYDNTDTLVASTTIGDEDYHKGLQMVDVFWDNVTIPANTTYRLTIKSTHATATVRPFRLTFPDTASRNWMPEGSNWSGTERTDAGGWTDTALELHWMGLWVNDITFTTGGGTTQYGSV